MREALKNAVHNAILLEYKLPHKVSGLDLDKSCLSSQNDICFSNSNPQEISKIIYNGIVEFAINEYEIDYTALEHEQRKAILSRMRYDSAAPDATKLKYGFYGEVLLDLILRVFLRTSVLAARGYGFENIVNGQPEILEHKNYDVQATKTDVDYQITREQYLSESERQEKASILSQVTASEIPPEVFDCFRVVGPKDKLILYSYISQMPWWTIDEIKRVSQYLAQSGAHRLYWNGFQQIMDMILPIVREDKLKQLITIRTGKQQQYSLVTVLLSSYLSGGFLSMVEFYVKRSDSPKTKDEAMRQVADFVYNVFKYHLVKYLGLFDVFFRYQVSKSENINMEDVAGLGLLLQKLEYNALSPNARKVSDYGVPFKLIDCYDSKTPYDKGQFDEYEQHIDQEISRLFT